MSKMSEGKVPLDPLVAPHRGRCGDLAENVKLSTSCGSCLVPRMCPAERGVHPCGDWSRNTFMASGSPARVASMEYRAITGRHG
jgi:hypothetical protein